MQLQALEADPIDQTIAKVERLSGPVMQVITGAMVAEAIEVREGGQTVSRKVLNCTASSTIEDLYGDSMDEACVRDMAEQAIAKGLTIFLNHKYAIPEDVFGKVFASGIKSDSVDPKSGLPIFDLTMQIGLAESNPRVAKTWQLIKEDGLQLGVSIGAMITEAEPKNKTDGWGGPLLISKLDLLEASIVGIPANQRSWTQYAATSPWLLSARKSLQGFYTAAATCPTCGKPQGQGGDCSNKFHKGIDVVARESHSELPDSAFACIDSKGRHYPHHHADGSIDKALLRNALARIADKSNAQCGAGHLHAHAKAEGIGQDKSAGDLMDPSTNLANNTTTTEGTVTITGENGSTTWSPTPGWTLLTVDTTTPGLQIKETDPTTATDAEDPDEDSAADEAAEPEDAEATTEGEADPVDLESAKEAAAALTVQKDQEPILTLVLEAFESAAHELSAVNLRVKELEAANLSLISDRDQAQRESKAAAEIVELIASLPLGRKTAFATQVEGFRAKFAGIYDDAYLQLIDSSDSAER